MEKFLNYIMKIKFLIIILMLIAFDLKSQSLTNEESQPKKVIVKKKSSKSKSDTLKAADNKIAVSEQSKPQNKKNKKEEHSESKYIR